MPVFSGLFPRWRDSTDAACGPTPTGINRDRGVVAGPLRPFSAPCRNSGLATVDSRVTPLTFAVDFWVE
jgi:hypothetical protein